MNKLEQTLKDEKTDVNHLILIDYNKTFYRKCGPDGKQLSCSIQADLKDWEKTKGTEKDDENT